MKVKNKCCFFKNFIVKLEYKRNNYLINVYIWNHASPFIYIKYDPCTHYKNRTSLNFKLNYNYMHMYTI